MCRWPKEKAEAYLRDFYNHGKFVGYVAEDNGNVIAALFAHEKVWWNNDEVFIDEMFVKPEYQGKESEQPSLLKWRNTSGKKVWPVLP